MQILFPSAAKGGVWPRRVAWPPCWVAMLRPFAPSMVTQQRDHATLPTVTNGLRRSEFRARDTYLLTALGRRGETLTTAPREQGRALLTGATPSGRVARPQFTQRFASEA